MLYKGGKMNKRNKILIVVLIILLIVTGILFFKILSIGGALFFMFYFNKRFINTNFLNFHSLFINIICFIRF